MRINLSTVPLIDTHCHKFVREREPAEFARVVSLSSDPHPIEDDQSMLVYDLLIQRMRRLYQLPVGTPDDEVIAERNRRYDADPAGYAAALRKASGVQYHCYDIGSPVSGDMNTPEQDAWFDRVAEPESVKVITRIEPVMRELFAQKLSFSEFLTKFDKRVRSDIEKHHAIALKSVIGYHTGLDVELVDAATAQKGYEAYLAGEGGEAAEKAIRDYMIPLSLEICKEFDIPMQFHTGIGSAPMCDLRKMRPASLRRIINDDRFKGKVKIVLLHAGYPWVEETGLLVNNFSHVYSDFSSMIYSAGTAGYRSILAMLEAAPTNKIMYASDAGGEPESLWHAALHFKDQLAKALEYYIAEDVIGYERAMQIAKNICRDNALRVYSRLQ